MYFLVAGYRIGADRDELERAILESAVGLNEVREFSNAGSAGSGPEVDEAKFVGFVSSECFGAFGVELFQIDGKGSPSGIVFGNAITFPGPLG